MTDDDLYERIRQARRVLRAPITTAELVDQVCSRAPMPYRQIIARKRQIHRQVAISGILMALVVAAGLLEGLR